MKSFILHPVIHGNFAIEFFCGPCMEGGFSAGSVESHFYSGYLRMHQFQPSFYMLVVLRAERSDG